MGALTHKTLGTPRALTGPPEDPLVVTASHNCRPPVVASSKARPLEYPATEYPTVRYPLVILLVGLIVAAVPSACRKRPPPPAAPTTQAAAPASSPATAPATEPAAPATSPTEPDSTHTPPDGPIDEARQAIANGDAALAVQILRQAVQDSPDLPTLRALADALLAAGEPAEAAAVCKQILADNADDVTALYNLAVAKMRLNRFRQAQEHLDRALELSPGNAPALYNMAISLEAQGKTSDARDAWVAVLAENDANPEAHSHLGVILMELKEFDEAFDHLRTAAVAWPDDADAWVNLAAAARATDSYGYAAVALRKATEIAPDDPVTWAALGDTLLTIYEAGGRDIDTLRKAIAAWRASLALDESQGRLQEAIHTYLPIVETAAATQPS